MAEQRSRRELLEEARTHLSGAARSLGGLQEALEQAAAGQEEHAPEDAER